MAETLRIGGAPVLDLLDREVPFGIFHAQVLPGRGMMLLQARARVPGRGEVEVLSAPDLEEAARALAGGPEDFAGNRSFSFGGAILLPYANRITGQDVAGERAIETTIAGRPARLPRNWGGKAPGARQYAMHGLILDVCADEVEQPSAREAVGRLRVGDFGGRWPGRAEVTVRYRLTDGALELAVETRNVGGSPLPLGVGWHPYFALPSGRREQAVLRLPAAARAPANNYDEVLPTGTIEPVEGSAFDFRAGRPLKGAYLDDTFTDLQRGTDGVVAAEVLDPSAGYGLRISTPSPAVKAMQVFAPPDEPFVVVEPQFNLADPYSEVWAEDVDTGMVLAPPGAVVSYAARLEVLRP